MKKVLRKRALSKVCVTEGAHTQASRGRDGAGGSGGFRKRARGEPSASPCALALPALAGRSRWSIFGQNVVAGLTPASDTQVLGKTNDACIPREHLFNQLAKAVHFCKSLFSIYF